MKKIILLLQEIFGEYKKLGQELYKNKGFTAAVNAFINMEIDDSSPTHSGAG